MTSTHHRHRFPPYRGAGGKQSREAVPTSSGNRWETLGSSRGQTSDAPPLASTRSTRAAVKRAIMARLAETASLDRADLTGLDPEMLDALVIAGRIVLDGSTLTLGHLDDMPPMSPEPCPTRGGPSEFPRALLGCSCLVCFEGLPR